MDAVTESASTPSGGRKRRSAESRAIRRFGYLVSAVINAVLIFVAHNLVAWDWFSWLTDDFNDLVPLITISLGATILANLAYLWFDGPAFKSSTTVITSVISFVLSIRMLQVYPFDFSAYSFNWDLVAKSVLILGIVGTGISVIVELVKLVRVRT